MSLEVTAGSLVGILGPNGAGKSTLFHLIAGHLRPDGGRVFIGDRDVTRLRPYQRAALGVGLVFQKPRLFEGMTVLQNVMAGRYLKGNAGMFASALRLPRHGRCEVHAEQASREQLARFGVPDRYTDEIIDGLPFGVQRRVAVAQALGVAGSVLLLDEPAAGLTGSERSELAESIADLKAGGMSILLIEHDVRFVASIADSLLVLDRGAVIAEGPVRKVLADPKVIEAYSGVGV
ncbi:ABC transporter ATP-binding protein [Microbacterium kribbense]|uniref:ABC transporter ATP-binding protein n=1 Tax=Microbacterium kribbense TaxID=433645 RepID=UPI0031D60B6E